MPEERALVLGGGGASGAYLAGVLWYLVDHPEAFPVDLVCGTSSGAVAAAAFAFGKVDQLVALWSRLKPHDVYRRRSRIELAWELFCRHRFTHLYDIRPLERLLESIFGDALMADSPLPLYLTAFNLQTAQLTVFDHTSPVRVVDALMASTAIQGLFPVRLLKGFQYLDGGNAMNLPLGPALNAGARDLLVVRANVSEEFVPQLYEDLISIQKRAYSVMVERTARSDLARAQELSEILQRAQAQRQAWQRLFQGLDCPGEIARLLHTLEEQPLLVPGHSELRLRLLEPTAGKPLPDLLAIDPAVSLGLLHLGYQNTAHLLEEE